MELQKGDRELEALNIQLNDQDSLRQYKEPYDHYSVSFIPHLFGCSLVWCGNIVYGKEPSYLKFRAIEVIARVPYYSWISASYTMLTFFYNDPAKAMKLSEVEKYARLAEDNETMHVVVISELAQKEGKVGFVRHTLIPMLFAFFYFWSSYILFLLYPRYSYELNYFFENHAFDQYDRFLEMYREELKQKTISSDFLNWYGRSPRTQYEFFMSVRNDEIIHRNTSIERIQTDIEKTSERN
ncbi:hypothetical protein K2X96_00050 [Patescibacteria group bacterium]|nr:hypothetical protein [Patescibacteria group bacterium]